MFLQILDYLIYPFLFLSLFAQIFILSAFLSGRKRMQEEEQFESIDFPKVTIVIPCWNESKNLTSTVDSIILSDYPKDKLEILIGDNNSIDNTLQVAEILQEKYKDICEIKMFKEFKQGKHHVINSAMDLSSADFFGCLDADTTLAHDAISKNMKYFSDPEIMSSTSCVKIKSPQKTWIQKLQSIEYLIGVFMRKSYGNINAIQVVPGPLSIYRKEIFQKIGGFRDGHKVEDFEMTIRLHRHHMKIANSHKAFVSTSGPSTLMGYFKQRIRWTQGGIENVLDNKDMIFNKNYNHFGLFVMPVIVIFIFYAVYALIFFFFHTYLFLFQKLSLWAAYDYSFNLNYLFNFKRLDIFYFNTNMIFFLAMLMLTLYCFAIYIGRIISESHKNFYRNFLVYFFLFPYLVFYFSGKSCLNVLFRKKNVWELQDNKSS